MIKLKRKQLATAFLWTGENREEAMTFLRGSPSVGFYFEKRVGGANVVVFYNHTGCHVPVHTGNYIVLEQDGVIFTCNKTYLNNTYKECKQ